MGFRGSGVWGFGFWVRGGLEFEEYQALSGVARRVPSESSIRRVEGSGLRLCFGCLRVWALKVPGSRVSGMEGLV